MKPGSNMLPLGLGALGLVLLFGSKKGQNVVSTVATQAQQTAVQAATAVEQTATQAATAVEQTATQAATAVEQAAVEAVDWVKKVIGVVSKHEGQYDSVNRNTDGAGLSFGMMQWAQDSGDLGVLLRKMNQADPTLFAQLFGARNTSQLLEVTRTGSKAPVAGVVLWQEPWVSRFQAAGRQPVFQRVQDQLAQNGEHMKAARDCAKLLNIATERSMALFLDTANQQGATGARNIARRTQADFNGHAAQVSQVLEAFVLHCAAPFITRTQPSSYWYNSKQTLHWQAVGAEWHVFTGQVDLYRNILSRRTAILRNKTLSDAPLNIA